MKKLFALTLAVAMVMSLATVAFAVDPKITVGATDKNNLAIAHVKSSGHFGTPDAADAAGNYAPDETYLFPIFVDGAALTKYEDGKDKKVAKGMKVKATWNQNGAMVDSVSILKFGAGNGITEPQYALAIAVKETASTSQFNIDGKIEISKSGLDKAEFDVFLPIRLGLSTNVAEFTDGLLKYDFDGNEDEEFEIELYGDVGTFTVDTNGQGKLVVKQDVEYNEGLENIFPDMNYVYINGNGARFNKIGTMILKAVETDVLYQLVDGKPVKVNAVYDDAEEGFVFKTRTIGQYVIAEKELDLTAIPAEAPAEGEAEVEAPATEAPATQNPKTGAAC